MDKSIVNISPADCTGCSACFNICPAHAITMQTGKNGFIYPSVSESKCTNCGLCLNKCPVKHPLYKNNSEPDCYAVMASDDVRKVSSSGGVFTLLAEWILESGGVVCGAAYTDNYHNVEHIMISKKDDLPRLRGSKYVQSVIGDVYCRIKDHLENGQPVLFTGTPCQAAGLKAFLGKDYEKLYVADLVCHGTPPQKLFKQFLDELEEEQQSKVIDVNFRDKEIEGWTHSTTIKFENGTVYHKKRNDSPYLNAFLQLLSLRDCCGHCPFAKLPRQGDITMADFWDIHRYDPELDDHWGTSAVLVNNEQGSEMLSVLKRSATKLEKVPLDHAIKYNAQIKYSSLHHKDRKRFFELIDDYHFSVEKAVDWALRRHFDIGYVGWWYGENYGSVLTSYAMNRVLKDMGKTVLMLDFPYLPGESSDKKDTPARRFAVNFYETSMRRQIDQHGDLNYYCDSFLVGSDQLWNWWSNRDIGSDYYFLDFADKKHRKIAYSTSFGHESGFYPEGKIIDVSYFLHRFDEISVRESSAVDICRDIYGVNATQTMDPVFLCSSEDYQKAIELSKVKINDPFVLAYILNPTDDKIAAVKLAAEEKSLPYYIIIDGQGDQAELRALINDDEHVVSDPEIADWLYYFANSEFIVTDSYHGFCFSIIFGKQMIVFPNKLRGLARFETLGNITDLSSRFVSTIEDVKQKNLISTVVDYDLVRKLLEPEIKRSRQWLVQALDSRIKMENADTLALWKIKEHDQKLFVFDKKMESEQNNIDEVKTMITDLTSQNDLMQKRLPEIDELKTLITNLTNQNELMQKRLTEVENLNKLLYENYQNRNILKKMLRFIKK